VVLKAIHELFFHNLGCKKMQKNEKNSTLFVNFCKKMQKNAKKHPLKTRFPLVPQYPECVFTPANPDFPKKSTFKTPQNPIFTIRAFDR